MSEKLLIAQDGELVELSRPNGTWHESREFPGYEFMYRDIYRKTKPKPYTETITWYPYPECVEEMGLKYEEEVLLKRSDGSVLKRWWKEGVPELSCGNGSRIIAVARMPKGEKCQS